MRAYNAELEARHREGITAKMLFPDQPQLIALLEQIQARWLHGAVTLLLLLALSLHSRAQVIPPVTSECATSIDGSVVGVQNPLSPPVVAAAFTGSLSAGNYFVQFAWNDATNHTTLVSPEVQVQLSGTGELQVSQPTSGMPASAAGMNVYIGTSSGSETLQGSVMGSGVYTQSVPLVSGAAAPTINTTACQVIANDAGWPTGTGYNVTMTTPAGDTMPGYPSQWQILGPGNTLNLSQGIPLYNGVVQFPSPVLATPSGHGQQSISGNLSLGGYSLFAANASLGAVNGALNPADCSTVSAPQWCAGSDIGAWTNAAIAKLGCGEIYLPAGNYAQTTSILLPRCIKLHGATGQGTRITWTKASGWAFVVADNNVPLDNNYNYLGALEDISILGPGIAGNTAGAIYLGGSDGGANSPAFTGPGSDPAANLGDHFNINRVRIFQVGSVNGFNVGIQFGANAWSDSIFQSDVSFCNTGIFFPPNIGLSNTGEDISIMNSSVSNNNGVGLLVGTGNFVNVSVVATSFDFNGAACSSGGPCAWQIQNGNSTSQNSISMTNVYLTSYDHWMQNYGYVSISGSYFTGGGNSGTLGYLIDNENAFNFTVNGGQFLNGGTGCTVNPAGQISSWYGALTTSAGSCANAGLGNLVNFIDRGGGAALFGQVDVQQSIVFGTGAGVLRVGPGAAVPSSLDFPVVTNTSGNSGIQMGANNNGGGWIKGVTGSQLQFGTYTGAFDAETYTKTGQFDSTGFGVGNLTPASSDPFNVDAFGRVHSFMTTTNTINQTDTNDMAGTSACVTGTKAITFFSVFANQPVIILSDETTAGGARVSAKSLTGFTVACTGASDTFDWQVIGNPN